MMVNDKVFCHMQTHKQADTQAKNSQDLFNDHECESCRGLGPHAVHLKSILHNSLIE